MANVSDIGSRYFVTDSSTGEFLAFWQGGTYGAYADPVYATQFTTQDAAAKAMAGVTDRPNLQVTYQACAVRDIGFSLSVIQDALSSLVTPSKGK